VLDRMDMDHFADIFVNLQARGKSRDKDRESTFEFFMRVPKLIQQKSSCWMLSLLHGRNTIHRVSSERTMMVIPLQSSMCLNSVALYFSLNISEVCWRI
jgi:hypothetical protein